MRIRTVLLLLFLLLCNYVKSKTNVYTCLSCPVYDLHIYMHCCVMHLHNKYFLIVVLNLFIYLLLVCVCVEIDIERERDTERN